MEKFSKTHKGATSELIKEKEKFWLIKKNIDQPSQICESSSSSCNSVAEELNVSLASGPGEGKKFESIFLDVCNIIERGFYFPSVESRDHTAIYIICSYLFDCHDFISYLAIEGAPGTGKTSFVKMMYFLMYNSILLMGTDSDASIVRAIASVQGSVCIDEIQGSIGDAYSGLHKLLTQGNHKLGARTINVVKITRESSGWKPKVFPIFCPKVISGYEISDHEAVRSRTYTIQAARQITSENVIGRQLDSNWHKDAAEIKNDLLLYRQKRLLGEVHESSLLEENKSLLNKLEPRALQVFRWLLAECQTSEVFHRIYNSIIKHCESQRRDRVFDRDVVLLKGILLSIQKNQFHYHSICQNLLPMRVTEREIGKVHRTHGLSFKKTSLGMATNATEQDVKKVIASLIGPDEDL